VANRSLITHDRNSKHPACPTSAPTSVAANCGEAIHCQGNASATVTANLAEPGFHSCAETPLSCELHWMVLQREAAARDKVGMLGQRRNRWSQGSRVGLKMPLAASIPFHACG
jgi:hypothetical protein